MRRGRSAKIPRPSATRSPFSRIAGFWPIGDPVSGTLIEIARERDLHRGFLAEQYEELLTRPCPGRHSAGGRSGVVPAPAMLRIVLRDALRFADLSETTEDLSNLADAILNATWRRSGMTCRSDAGEFSIIALGKLGRAAS